MNKKLILCVVLALSLILVGTGYAYWTDTLNVTTKATTGDLDVTFVDLGAYAQYDNEYGTGSAAGSWSIIDGIGETGFVPANFFERGTNTYNDVFGNPDQRGAYETRAKGYNSIEMEAELDNPGTPLTENHPSLPYGVGHNYGDTISLELYNMYPGYAQAFRSDIINIGTIAAKLSALDFELQAHSNPEILKMIGVALLVQDENPIVHGNIARLASNYSGDQIFTLGNVEFVRLSALMDEVVDIEDNYILAPYTGSQHRGDLFIGVAVDPDAEGEYTTGSVEVMADNNDDLTQNQNILLNIKLGWDQFNEGVEADATNILHLQNGN